MMFGKIFGPLVAASLALGGITVALAAKTKSEFKNLKVLPKTITKDEMKTVMRGQSKGLGVDCDFCHDENDMASDANEIKLAARDMMKMTAELNGKYFKHVAPEDKLQCSTCHRGLPKPVPYVPGENKKILEEAAAQEAAKNPPPPSPTPTPTPTPSLSPPPKPTK